MAPQPVLGIGITTFNRRDMLLRAIEAIRRHTVHPHVLFVADDGSSDETASMLATSGVAHLCAPNRGIAWNKNRALFYLNNIRKCDVVILIEDDTFPIADGWERVWVEGALKYGHLNLAPSHWPVNYLAGDGSVASPFVSRVLTGQCAVLSRLATETVGFMDSRFRKYGFEHVEHTHRLIRAGFGGIYNREFGDLSTYLIRSDLVVEGLDKPPDMDGIKTNMQIVQSLANEPLYRSPWRGDEEMALFRHELRSVNDRDWHERAVQALEPAWRIRCHNNVELMIDPTRACLHGSPSFAPQSLPVCLSPVGEAFVLRLVDPAPDSSARVWIKLQDAESVVLVDEPAQATRVHIASSSGPGFALMANGVFACCDADRDFHVTVSRPWINDWEIFRFDGYVLDALQSAST